MLKIYLILVLPFCAADNVDFWVNIGNLLRVGDDEFGVTRPCPAVDMNCIRQFFARYSLCSISYGPVPDPYVLKKLDVPVPHGNITFTWTNAQVKGLNDWEVKEFFFNNVTKKLVFEVEFSAISIGSPHSVALYHRKGKEPVELADFVVRTYKSVSMTLVIPFDKYIEMGSSHVYSYVGESSPRIVVGKKFFKPDSDIQAAFDKILGDISTTMQEALVTQGPIYFAVFMESAVCSFKDKGNPLSEWPISADQIK